MFKIALTCGWKSTAVSNWKLEISATVTVASVVSAATLVYGIPIFPTTLTSSKYACIISPSNEVVVVFPFVPVIARSLPFAKWYASSISPQTGIPCPLIVTITGRSVGTPGLNTASPVSAKISIGRSPKMISQSFQTSFFCNSSFDNSLFPS